ncbi:helix-turn-helix domain-containing protein [Gordonia sp. PKS22-38]|uniref:Helix-turn-helix domain-containing protein n=1 Tax=Gordonia prachuapensis TaxID=3115651 RepID=A0ABU7MQQ9_9ACTN|nr:helix-turn-helix domain-containing protein [Gordonia sp. PKS22-38]
MRQWIPVSTSPKGRLALRAVEQFGSKPFDEVTVGALASAAEVTTGALYHHFDSKLGLYQFVRADVEQRLLDRMSGAAATSRSASEVLLVGFDYAVAQRFAYLLGQPPPKSGEDPVAQFVDELLGHLAITADPTIIAALWRAALISAAAGTDRARDTLVVALSGFDSTR